MQVSQLISPQLIHDFSTTNKDDVDSNLDESNQDEIKNEDSYEIKSALTVNDLTESSHSETFPSCPAEGQKSFEMIQTKLANNETFGGEGNVVKFTWLVCFLF